VRPIAAEETVPAPAEEEGLAPAEEDLYIDDDF